MTTRWSRSFLRLRKPGTAAGRGAALGLLLGLLALAAQAQRPQLALSLQAASSSLADPTYLYVEAGATTGFDSQLDAAKLLNSNGLNLASLITGGQRLSINALPPSVFAAPLALNLYVSLPQADTYALVVTELTNFSFVATYLNDAATGAHQLLTLGSTYTFSLANGPQATSTRFSLSFEPTTTPLPLPVTLVAFTAEVQGSDGLLRWATAAELNTAYFQVESSLDGTTFQALGRVAGAGTSSQAHAYQFVDENLAHYAVRQVYYRLRQVDADGSGTYSPVRLVQGPLAAGLLIQAYPNPSQLGTDVVLVMRTNQTGSMTFQLTDVLGRQVDQQQTQLPAGTSSLALPGTAQLARGVYVLRVRQGSQQQTLKFVRQ